MFHGVIYGYRDPTTGKLRYVGQTDNLPRRHKTHLARSFAVGKWLRSFISPPQPEILCEVTGSDRQVFVGDMANRETVAMFHHHTYVISYPDEGGLNKSIPQSNDYKNAGRIGGRIGGVKGGRKNAESGHIQRIGAMARTREHQILAGHAGGHKNTESGHIQKLGRIWGRKAVERGQIQSLGHIQGRKNVENGHLANIRTSENLAKAGRVNVDSGHISQLGKTGIGPHTHWHVNRGIVNPVCSFCGEI